MQDDQQERRIGNKEISDKLDGLFVKVSDLKTDIAIVIRDHRETHEMAKKHEETLHGEDGIMKNITLLQEQQKEAITYKVLWGFTGGLAGFTGLVAWVIKHISVSK